MRPKILCLVHRVPYPPDKGDRIRAYHLLRWIAGRADIHLACLADEPVETESADALKRLCERVEIIRLEPRSRWARALGSLARGRTITEGAFDSPRLREIVRRWTSETRYQASLASASSMIPYLLLEGSREVPAVVDLVDVDSQKWYDYAEVGRGPKSLLYRIEGRRLRRLEAGLPGWAKAATLVSRAETGLYRGFAAPGSGIVAAVPNGVDLEYFRPVEDAVDKPCSCVFVGVLDYKPNVDAACWFARDVLPELRRKHPEATFKLVGRRPSSEVRRLVEIPGVDLVGQVPDVRPHVSSSAVVVAPLRIARGLQNKVLEALAMGKAVVSSPAALAGLWAEPGIHALSASTPEEWVSSISSLFDDRDRRRELGRAGRRYAEENHDWERCLEPFRGFLDLPPDPVEIAS